MNMRRQGERELSGKYTRRVSPSIQPKQTRTGGSKCINAPQEFGRRIELRTCIMWGMASTIAPTSKSPMALERHRPPGHTLRGPHPSAVGPLAGPEPAQSYTALSARQHHKKL